MRKNNLIFMSENKNVTGIWNVLPSTIKSVKRWSEKERLGITWFSNSYRKFSFFRSIGQLWSQAVQKTLNILVVSAVGKSVIKPSSHPGSHHTQTAHPGMNESQLWCYDCPGQS